MHPEDSKEFDFTELDEAIKRLDPITFHKHPMTPTKNDKNFLSRIFSQFIQKQYSEAEQPNEKVYITCRLCDKSIISNHFEQHTENCAALQECLGEKARTDALLRLIHEHLVSTEECELEKFASSAILINDTSKSAIMTLAKIQYKLTKLRLKPFSEESFKKDLDRLSFLLDRKKLILERIRLVAESSSNESQSKLMVLLSVVIRAKSEQIPDYPMPSIHDFHILKPLSKGAFGSIYLARYKKTEDLYAIKAIKKAATFRKNSLSHALTERRALALIKSPWVVSLFYAFQSEEYLFLVMEYMIGGDLGTFLRVKSRFSLDMVRFYGYELLCAISLLHSHGIIHHDIKPENVLIGSDGHVKLIDLGLARVKEMQAERNAMYTDQTPLGTPDYMAPEIIRGEPYGHAVDVWAFGCLLYELYFGIPPFHEDTPEAIFNRVLNRNIPKDLPENDLVKFIESLIKYEPKDRPTAEECKLHPFFADVSWNEPIDPPFIPKPISEDDTVYFELNDRRPSIHADMQEALLMTAYPPRQQTKPITQASPINSLLSSSMSGQSSLSSSPFDSVFSFKNVDLLESVNKRVGQQMRAASGASSPLRRQ